PGLSALSDQATASCDSYTLSLHDALPISRPASAPARSSWSATDDPRRRSTGGTAPRLPAARPVRGWRAVLGAPAQRRAAHPALRDRKSTRLNSSHVKISYAVFCLKKKN